MKGLWFVLSLLVPVSSLAQPVPGRFEAAFGGRWMGGADAGNESALLTQPDDQPFTLFTTASRTTAVPAIEGRLGVRATQTLVFEGTVSYGAFDLRSRISSDFEGIADVTPSETVTQFTVELSVIEYLPRLMAGNRAIPYVSLGAGVARQLHEGRTLVATGGIGHIGGGMALLTFARPDARLKALGLRVDARVLFRQGGVTFDDAVTVSPSAGASVFVRF